MTGPAGRDAVGDLAIVLHSHMPYVEGFGTYPFGEEWLFDAVLRSHLPVLELARDLTMTVTPVLADQLEDGGVQERLSAFLDEFRIGSAAHDLDDVEPQYRAGVEHELERYQRARKQLDAVAGSPLEAFRRAANRGVELIPSTATHAVLPLLASRQGQRLQIDAGLRSHRRRFGACRGFWLPECAYDPGLEHRLREAGVAWFCTDQSAHQEDAEALVPIASAGGPVAFAIDWPAVELAWSWGGYPSAPVYADFHRISHRGMRIFSIAGEPLDPAASLARARQDARSFLASIADRLAAYRRRSGSPGLCVFAIDTELLGHWWSEGPAWLEVVLELAADAGIRTLTLSEALTRHPARGAPLHRSSWGAGKNLRTWDSPRVADLAWAARRLELRTLSAIRAGAIPADCARRAARELLALQASDWAFLDHRGEAGDYAFGRAVDHGEALVEALAGKPTSASLRSLAPDLSLTPLISPVP